MTLKWFRKDCTAVSQYYPLPLLPPKSMGMVLNASVVTAKYRDGETVYSLRSLLS